MSECAIPFVCLEAKPILGRMYLISCWKAIFLWSSTIYCSLRFCGLVKEILSDAVGSTLELEGEIDGETLEVCQC